MVISVNNEYIRAHYVDRAPPRDDFAIIDKVYITVNGTFDKLDTADIE